MKPTLRVTSHFFAFIVTMSNLARASQDLKPEVRQYFQSEEGNPSGVVNSIGMKFRPVKGTEVMFCVHETRVKDFHLFARETGADPSPWVSTKFTLAGQSLMIERNQGEHPVVNVSVKDALAFCQWLGKKDGRIYRLPTDYEWSCAAGLAATEQPHGDPFRKSGLNPSLLVWGTPRKLPATGNYWDATARKTMRIQDASISNDLANYDDGFALTAPVMSFKPNAFGLYDVGGNVKEWCATCSGDQIVSFNTRDASWAPCVPGELVGSYRGKQSLEYRGDSCGFRIVMVNTGFEGNPTDTEVVVVRASSRPEGGLANAKIDFQKEVLPIFESRCFSCHGEKKQKGRLRLDHPDFIKRGGECSVPAVVAGKPEGSAIYQRITKPLGHDEMMPASNSAKEPLKPEQIQLVHQWIKQGADFGQWQPVNSATATRTPTQKPEGDFIVKGYSIPIPEGWVAASSSGVQKYNSFLADAQQFSEMDGRFVQNNFPLIGLPGIDICIVPRGISNEALTHLRETQEVALKEVDAVQPWLHHMKLEGTYYDPKSEILFSQTSSIGADGTKMAYNGAILFRDGKQVEIHANSLLSDKDSMAKLVAKIATGVSRAPK